MRSWIAPSLLLLCGCAAPPSGGSGGAAWLADSAWRFTAIDKAPPVSGRAHLTFTGNHLGANVGCNGMGGTWRVENGRLVTGPLMQTEMYCEGPVWGQEKAIGALLASAPKFDVRGNRMTLTSSGHSAELERADPAAN